MKKEKRTLNIQFFERECVKVSAPATAPIDEKRLYVDTFSVQVPLTVYVGGSTDGVYVSIKGGINGPTDIHIILRSYLPWHWFKNTSC